MNDIILETRDLVKYFDTKSGKVHAVDHVDLNVPKGQTLGVVGESGCGKSTLGRCVVNLLPITSGQILFDNKDIHGEKVKHKELCQKMQIIFQDPYSSLDPRKNVFNLIAEPLRVNHLCSRSEMQDRVKEMMDTVGLSPELAQSYPHELDGGRRQRIDVARALITKPNFVVCDEPVSALDVSIQAQILNLMMDIQDKSGVAYMFITHDLSVVKHISQIITVMYLGQVVEQARTDELFAHPLHPYTMALFAALPIPDPSRRRKKRTLIKGEVTSPIDPLPGCRFASRCPYATSECAASDIPLIELERGHMVRCLHPQE